MAVVINRAYTPISSLESSFILESCPIERNNFPEKGLTWIEPFIVSQATEKPCIAVMLLVKQSHQGITE